MTNLALAGRTFDLTHRCLVMGILNLTPDSFSDGGRFMNTDAALAHVQNMVQAGADIIDVGGESTRPGARRISAEEEARRILGVITAIVTRFDVPVSVDTSKAYVADLAIEAGAAMINDVSGLGFDPDMVAVAVKARAPVVIMHSSAEPEVMQQHTTYQDVVAEVRDALWGRARFAQEQGIDPGNIILDPGLCFGKTVEQNFSLIRRLDEIVKLGYPVLVGASRKSFIGATLNLPTDQRLEGSLAMQCAAYLGGVRIFRVHDVEPAVRAARMLEALDMAP